MERDLLLKVRADTEGVQSKLGGVADGVAAVGTAGAKVGPAAEALDKVAAAAQKVAPAAKAASVEEIALARALAEVVAGAAKLDNADTPIAKLGKTAALTTVAMENLAKAEEKARAAGVKVGPEVGAAMLKANSSIDGATKKLGQYKDAMGEVGKASNVSADKLQALRGSAGSLEGMLDGLANTTGATGKKFGEMALSGFAIVGAFKAGWEAGKMIDKGLKELGVDLGALSEKAIAFVSGAGKEYPKTMDEWAVHTGSALDKLHVLGRAVQGAADEVRKALPDWKTDAEVKGALQIKVAALEKAYVTVTKAGGDWTAEAKRNSAAILALAAETEKEKGSLAGLSPELQKTIADLRALALAAKESGVALTAGVTTPVIELIAAYQNGKLTADEFAAAIENHIKLGGEMESEYGKMAEAILASNDAMKSNIEFMKQLAAEGEKIVNETFKNVSAAYDEVADKARAWKEAMEEGTEAMGDMTEATDMQVASSQALTSSIVGNSQAIDQMSESIYDGDPAMESLMGQLDHLVDTAPVLAIYMNDLANRFKSGQISANELNLATQSLKSGLDNLNSVGGGFLGDIDTKFYDILKVIQQMIDTIGGPGSTGRRP